MFGLSRKTQVEDRRRRTDYVVVQYVPGTDHVPFIGQPYPLEDALRIFEGILASVPDGFFAPHTGARIKVMTLSDARKSRLAEALLAAT